MKREILFLMVLLFSTQLMFAQLHISTNLRQDAVYNDETQSYDKTAEDQPGVTFIDFSANYTLFTHKTKKMSSTYSVTSSETNDEDETILFDIVSDVGNTYTMVLDVNNSQVFFLYEVDGKIYLIRHNIKKLWLDK